MKRILALVKPFRAQAVIEAIGAHEPIAVTVHEAKGYGQKKELLDRTSEFGKIYLPKIVLDVLAADDHAGPIIAAIEDIARTGRVGDGKIFLFDLEAQLDF